MTEKTTPNITMVACGDENTRSDSCAEYTYDCIDLNSSDEEFDFIETSDEESVNAFFSADPEDIREKKSATDIVKTRERKWTVYDLTSAKFIPASSNKISKFTNH